MRWECQLHPKSALFQVLSFTFLVVEKGDKARKNGDPGNEFNGFSVSLRCFSISPRNSQLSNMHLLKLLFASYMVKQTVITIFVKSLLKYNTTQTKSTKYDVYVRRVRLRMIKDS